MHEFSIASNIVDVVNKTAQDNGISRVTRVKLKVGQLQLIMPDSLLFSFNICTKGTVSEGAVLDIEEVTAKGECAGCGAEFSVGNYQFICPSCGSPDINVVSGEELFIESLEGE
jgi:hydrogenase nickel incorporation protein HypA/HybF